MMAGFHVLDRKGLELFKIFKSHLAYLVKMLGVLIILIGSVLYYSTGDKFFESMTILVAILFLTVPAGCFFLTFNAVNLLKSAGFTKIDSIGHGVITTNAPKEVVISNLIENSFEEKDRIYQRSGGFYKFASSAENYPLIRLSLVECEGKNIKIKLIDFSEKKLAMNTHVFVFLAKVLTSRGYTVSFTD